MHMEWSAKTIGQKQSISFACSIDWIKSKQWLFQFDEFIKVNIDGNYIMYDGKES